MSIFQIDSKLVAVSGFNERYRKLLKLGFILPNNIYNFLEYVFVYNTLVNLLQIRIEMYKRIDQTSEIIIYL